MTAASTDSRSALARERSGAFAAAARAVAYLLLAGFTLSPLLWASVPPLVDYPNHLARMWILAADGKIAPLAGNYFIQWKLVPNLAIDLIVPPLAQILPLDIAGRIFIALTMAGLLGGTMALHRALHGRIGLWPLCALLFIYNGALYWGFLNSLFGTALYLLAFAGWIASCRWPLVSRLVLFSLAAALILLAHLFAFGLYALSVASYEFAARVRWPRPTLAGLVSFGLVCLQFAPAVILWGLSAPSAGPTLTHFGAPSDKLRALMAPVNFAGESPPALDVLCFCATYILLFLATWRRSLVLAPGMRLPMIALVVTAALTPNWLYGSWLADIRMPVALPFIIIGATQLTLSRRTGAALAAIALAQLGLRVWTVTQTWRDEDRVVTAVHTTLASLPPGARLLAVEAPLADEDRAVPGLPPALALRGEERFWHLPALAVIDRSAFIPYLFSGLTTVRPTARHAGLYVEQGLPVSPQALLLGMTRESLDALPNTKNALGYGPYWARWPTTFDYILWLDFAHREPDLDALHLVAESGPVRLYQIVRPR